MEKANPVAACFAHPDLCSVIPGAALPHGAEREKDAVRQICPARRNTAGCEARGVCRCCLLAEFAFLGPSNPLLRLISIAGKVSNSSVLNGTEESPSLARRFSLRHGFFSEAERRRQGLITYQFAWWDPSHPVP